MVVDKAGVSTHLHLLLVTISFLLHPSVGALGKDADGGFFLSFRAVCSGI